MLPKKNFEKLHAVMAILMLFEKFSNKFCINFLTLILKSFTKYYAFCAQIFDYACLRRKNRTFLLDAGKTHTSI